MNLESLQKQQQKHPCSGKPDQKIPHGPTIWMVMQRNVWSDTARWRKTLQQLYKVITSCLDDHQFKEEELGSVGELTKVCSQIVLKCLYLARIGRPDILRSVNKLARAVTKWTRACDKRLARLISYIHHTCDYKQCCHVGCTAKQCRLGLFQDSDFAGDLEDSKSTSGEFCAHLDVIRLFQSVRCVRNKLQLRRVQQNLELFLSMKVHAWMEFPLSIFGIL